MIADGAVPAADADPEAAASLAQDGLVLVADGWLLAPPECREAQTIDSRQLTVRASAISVLR